MNNYQSTEIEFSVVEVVTAAIDTRLLTGESYTGPIHIGYYKAEREHYNGIKGGQHGAE